MGNICSALLKSKDEIIDLWLEQQEETLKLKVGTFLTKEQLKEDSYSFFTALLEDLKYTNLDTISLDSYADSVKVLKEITNDRAIRGSSPIESFIFFFSLKNAIFKQLKEEFRDSTLMNEYFTLLVPLLEQLSLEALDLVIKSREELIKGQSEALIALSSPIITIWKNIVAVPIIGTLDSNRAQFILEKLLNRIVKTASKIAILDITGVAVVDTAVSKHLLTTVKAIKLLGAEAIITGISPEVAETMVHLGLDLSFVKTSSTLASGLEYAFKMLNLYVGKRE
ncbi:MAG: STAS domain-containing protein [Candidatus Hodarchaeales archaeon]